MHIHVTIDISDDTSIEFSRGGLHLNGLGYDSATIWMTPAAVRRLRNMLDAALQDVTVDPIGKPRTSPAGTVDVLAQAMDRIAEGGAR